jgi:CBS domain-containing protein
MSDPSQLGGIEGSYRAPSYEHARVSDAMRAGVITCPPDASLRMVARMMASNHVHAVVVTAGGDAPLGVVTDRDLLRAGGKDVDETTAESITADPATALPDDTLAQAAQAMVDHGVSHLIVIDADGRPQGVISSLDVAGVLAWGLA